jgi:hypothetical protein
MFSGSLRRNIGWLALAVMSGAVLGFIMSRVRFEPDNPIIPGLTFTIDQADYHVQAYMLILLVTTLLFVFLLAPRLAAKEDKWFLKVLIYAFFVKVGVTLFRLWWAYGYKNGVSDATQYWSAGRDWGPEIRNLNFDFIAYALQPGTDFVEVFTAFVMAVIGETLPGNFLFFSLMAFAGSVLYYKAFRTAFPDGNRKLYAALIFFYPSWIYWVSSMGKDSMMALAIGLMAYGVALLFNRSSTKGMTLFILGAAMALMVRPHIVGLLGLAMALPLTLKPPVRNKTIAPILRVFYLGIAISGAFYLVTNAATYLNLESTSIEATLERYEDYQSNAQRGGSAFEPTPITHPMGVPMAFLTLLFRPFPWEAPNAAALVLAMEGVTLAGVMTWRAGSLRKAIASVGSNPYVLFVLVYFVASAMALTVIGNFSLLGRQRLMVIPLFFMLLAQADTKEERAASGESLHQAKRGNKVLMWGHTPSPNPSNRYS